jgi:hypothetical protein
VPEFRSRRMDRGSGRWAAWPPARTLENPEPQGHFAGHFHLFAVPFSPSAFQSTRRTPSGGRPRNGRLCRQSRCNRFRFGDSVVYRGQIPGLPTAIKPKSASQSGLAPPFSPPNYCTRPHRGVVEFSDIWRIAGKTDLPAAPANSRFHFSIFRDRTPVASGLNSGRPLNPAPAFRQFWRSCAGRARFRPATGENPDLGVCQNIFVLRAGTLGVSPPTRRPSGFAPRISLPKFQKRTGLRRGGRPCGRLSTAGPVGCRKPSWSWSL